MGKRKTLSGRGRRRKGQDGEREVRDILRRIPGFEGAERAVQARHGGRDASDVEGTPYHVEVKMQALAPSPHAAMRQAREEADEGRPILVFTRKTTGPREEREWLVTMPAQQFVELRAVISALQEKLDKRSTLDMFTFPVRVRRGERDPSDHRELHGKATDED